MKVIQVFDCNFAASLQVKGIIFQKKTFLFMDRSALDFVLYVKLQGEDILFVYFFRLRL